MRKFLAGMTLIAGAVSAHAADLPVQTPSIKAPVAVIYDWTGFYIGANAGVGMARDYTRLVSPVGIGGGLVSAEASYLSPQGGIGGGQIGYNWQVPNTLLGPLVFGVEADIQGTSLGDNYTCLLTCQALLNSKFNQTLDWFGTVRGRIGIATGPVLSYVTAGWAYGSAKTTLTESMGMPGVFQSNLNRGGWTWGSGVEAALGGNWTAKIEYLYVNLGDRQNLFTLTMFPQAMSTDIREQIYRVGLNYRIGGKVAAYVTPPAANWAGFYLGGNIGSGTGRDQSVLNEGGIPFGPVITERLNLSPDGINGGIQAGYNWQAANWVFGLEADIQGSSQRDNRACALLCTTPLIFAAYDARLPWFGTARGRVGYSVGSTLFYATGGYAYGSVETKIAFVVVPSDVTLSEAKGGWTAGAGVETPFTLLGLFSPNWTSKTEYLYVDLGTSAGAFTLRGGLPLSNSTQVHEHIFRTGANYHLNSPVVAKY